MYRRHFNKQWNVLTNNNQWITVFKFQFESVSISNVNMLLSLHYYCQTIKHITFDISNDILWNTFEYLLSEGNFPQLESIKLKAISYQKIKKIGKYCLKITKIECKIIKNDLTFENLIQNIPNLKIIIISKLKLNNLNHSFMKYNNIIETRFDFITISLSNNFPNLINLHLKANFETTNIKEIIPFNKVTILQLNSLTIKNILHFFPNLIDLNIFIFRKIDFNDLIEFKTKNYTLNNINKLIITFSTNYYDLYHVSLNNESNDSSSDTSSDTSDSSSDSDNSNNSNDTSDSSDSTDSSVESLFNVNLQNKYNNKKDNTNIKITNNELLYNLLILFPNLIHLELNNNNISLNLLKIINENMNNLKILNIQLIINNNIENNELIFDILYNLAIKLNKLTIIFKNNVKIKYCILFIIKLLKSQNKKKTIRFTCKDTNESTYDIQSILTKHYKISKIEINTTNF